MARFLCSIIDDMKQCYETRNFSPLPGLMHELQIGANRMEAKLDIIRDFDYYEEEYRGLKKQCKDLKKQIKEKKKELEDLDIPIPKIEHKPFKEWGNKFSSLINKRG